MAGSRNETDISTRAFYRIPCVNTALACTRRSVSPVISQEKMPWVQFYYFMSYGAILNKNKAVAITNHCRLLFTTIVVQSHLRNLANVADAYRIGS